MDEAGADGLLYWLDATDHLYKARLKQRNACGEHPYQSDDEMFDLLKTGLKPLSTGEKWNLRLHFV